jgi:hypothetical protein
MDTMNRPGFHGRWEAEPADTLTYYKRTASEPARTDTDETMPGSQASLFLDDAIYVRFCFPNERALATLYLEKGKAIADAAVAQGLFRHGRAAEIFPYNRARVLRTRIIIDGLLLGVPPDASLCRQAARDHAEFANDIELGLWDAGDQGHYEDAIELLLMAGLLDDAAEMIKNARSMRGKGVKERFTGSKAIVKAGTCPITDPKVRDAYMAMFDTVRDPQFDTRGGCPLTVVEKFSLGVLWDKYFVSTDGTIDWDRALEATRA